MKTINDCKTLKHSKMKRVIKKSDFTFRFVDYETYEVTYVSPVTCIEWIALLPNMPLIDAVKYKDKPLRKNMEALRRMIKTYCR